jgi:hypothetical protein
MRDKNLRQLSNIEVRKNMTEYNYTELQSKAKQEIIKNLPVKTQQQVYDELRNDVIEEVAVAIERMTGFGQDTISSFAIYIRGMKK